MSLLLCLYCLTMLWSLLLCLYSLFLFVPKPLGPWAHGPRPLGPIGPIRTHAAACSHAVAWPGPVPGPGPRLFWVMALAPGPGSSWSGWWWLRSNYLVRTFLFYGPKAPGAHRAHILLLKSSYFRLCHRLFFWDFGCPKNKKGVFLRNMCTFEHFCYFGQCWLKFEA